MYYWHKNKCQKSLWSKTSDFFPLNICKKPQHLPIKYYVSRIVFFPRKIILLKKPHIEYIIWSPKLFILIIWTPQKHFFSCVLYPTHDKRDLKYWHFPWGRISIMGMFDLLRRQTINFLQESSCGKLWLKRQRGRINLILVSQLESFLKDRHLGASLHPICQDTLQPTHLPA